MKAAGGRKALVTAALLIAGVRLWMQVRGKTKTPFGEWAAGYGALFFILAIMAEASPEAAGALALTVVVGVFLTNGASLFTDVSAVVTGAEHGPALVAEPFSASTNAASKGKLG